MMNFTDIQQLLDAYTNKLNGRIFESIAQNGLVPLGSIDEKCLVNFVLASSSKVQKNICVNYLDLRGCHQKQIDAAITVALWEEYTGAFGISLERAWPLSSCDRINPLVSQIVGRLWQNIVFVLKPPVEKISVGNINNAQKFMNVCYQKNQGLSPDGFSQERGCLLTDNSNANAVSEHVTEIKTEKHFSSADILAILVPEHLKDLAEKFFLSSGFKIIPVSMTKSFVTLNRIPKILESLHGQKIEGSLDFNVPDYEKILKENIVPKYGNFSLHTVRLITPYDISIRYIDNVSNTQQILQSTQAKIVKEYADGSGWALVHASQVLKVSEETTKMLAIRMQTSLEKLVIQRVNTAVRDALIAAKGSHAMINYFDTLHEQARRNLSALGIKGVALNGYMALSVPQQYKDQIHKDMNAVLGEGEKHIKQTAAATCIQSLVRGHQVCALTLQYKAAQVEYALAQQRLAEVGSKLGIKN